MVVDLTARYRRNGPVYGAGERIALPDAEARDLIARGGAREVVAPKEAIAVDDVFIPPNKMVAPGGKGRGPQPDVKRK